MSQPDLAARRLDEVVMSIDLERSRIASVHADGQRQGWSMRSYRSREGDELAAQTPAAKPGQHSKIGQLGLSILGAGGEHQDADRLTGESRKMPASRVERLIEARDQVFIGA